MFLFKMPRSQSEHRVSLSTFLYLNFISPLFLAIYSNYSANVKNVINLMLELFLSEDITIIFDGFLSYIKMVNLEFCLHKFERRFLGFFFLCIFFTMNRGEIVDSSIIYIKKPTFSSEKQEFSNMSAIFDLHNLPPLIKEHCQPQLQLLYKGTKKISVNSNKNIFHFY